MLGISDELFWRLSPRLYLMRWDHYAAEQRRIDGRFGLLAEILWNGTFTERRKASDFFPSLAAAHAEATREPRTEEEAREWKLKQGEMILAKMRAAWG